MAGICCGVVGEREATASVEPNSRPRRKRMELLQLKYIADVAVSEAPLLGESRSKRQKSLDLGALPAASSSPRVCEDAVENRESRVKDPEEDKRNEAKHDKNELVFQRNQTVNTCSNSMPHEKWPKYGVTSVCGRRRDMEDAVSIQTYFCEQENQIRKGFHFYGLYDGHGCSHVATMCKERLHEIVMEELLAAGDDDNMNWKGLMEKCFSRMDDEVSNWSNAVFSCRCELQTPHCEAVGSTAVVSIVTPDKIIVANCGDSRAVLCRNGVAIPLSSDHKPNRPDELLRVEKAGGRVIYWDGPRVLGVLAMSRAIGDGYLKPYVISEPEVMIVDRTAEDECLILSSDGLWDVVRNDTACNVARMCLRASLPGSPGNDEVVSPGVDGTDKACSDASVLLTKLALARHSTDNVSVVVVDLRR